MDSLTVFLVSMGLSIICLIFLLIIAFILFAVYYFGVIPNRNSAVEADEYRNKLALLKREIEAQKVRKRDIESQINERQKIFQIYEGNKQNLIVDIQKHEQSLAKKEKENRLSAATRQDFQRQIADKKKILQTFEDNERQLINNIQYYEQEINQKKEDLHLLETRLLELSKKSNLQLDTPAEELRKSTLQRYLLIAIIGMGLVVVILCVGTGAWLLNRPRTTASVINTETAAAAPTEAPRERIGLSFSDFATERWKNEAILMEKLLKDKGYDVMIQEANHDVNLQNEQIDNMVAQGANALIVVAEDGDAVVSAVDRAAQAGVKVIAYDRLIKTASVSAYISFDFVEVGRQQAAGVLKALDIDHRTVPVKLVKLGGSPTDNSAILFRKGQDEVLQKYVDSKKIEIVADQWVDNWDPANALKLMENILTASGNKVDAVVASNDGTALGALQAMKAQNLAGKVPISGQDATADGCNSIVKGELTVTIFKDIRKLSPLAVDLTDKLLKGEPISDLKEVKLAELTNDPAKLGNLKALFPPLVQITKDNVYDEIVKSGFQSYDDVYRDIPEAGRPPRP